MHLVTVVPLVSIYIVQKLNAARTDVEMKTKEVDEMKKTVRTISAETEEKKHLLVGSHFSYIWSSCYS